MGLDSDHYYEYINSDKWRKTRELRLDLDNYECCLCGCKENLRVHHLTYENLGEEIIEQDLMTLCDKCHELVHKLLPTLRQPLYSAKWKAIEKLSSMPEFHKINEEYITDMREALKNNLVPIYSKLQKKNRKNMAKLLTTSLSSYEFPSLLISGYNLKGNRYANVLASIKEYNNENKG